MASHSQTRCKLWMLLTLASIPGLIYLYLEEIYSSHDIKALYNNAFKDHYRVPLVHQLPNKNDTLRKLSEQYRNETEFSKAIDRVQEVTKEMEEHSEKLSRADLLLLLRTVRNESAAEEIRKIVSKNVSRCQAMQIIRPGVPDMKIVFESDLKNVTTRNQSDCVPTYDSCAIVGNSGILVGSQCGDVIDSADLVIRNNMAPIDDRFARDVGTRADVVSINLTLIRQLGMCTKVHKVAKMPQEVNCTALKEAWKIFRNGGRIFWFFKRYTKLFHEMKAMLSVLRTKHKLDFRLGYSPIIPMDIASQLAKVRTPSSGLAVYAAATQFCKSVNLFGFYPFNDIGTQKNIVMNHYYDTKVVRLRNNHAMPDEFAWLEKQHGRGALRMINNCSSLRTWPEN